MERERERESGEREKESNSTVELYNRSVITYFSCKF